MSNFRVTVDTGGTFSDFVIFDESTGRYRILKVPSTPDDPGRAVLNGLDQLAEGGLQPDTIGFFEVVSSMYSRHASDTCDSMSLLVENAVAR